LSGVSGRSYGDKLRDFRVLRWSDLSDGSDYERPGELKGDLAVEPANREACRRLDLGVWQGRQPVRAAAASGRAVIERAGACVRGRAVTVKGHPALLCREAMFEADVRRAGPGERALAARSLHGGRTGAPDHVERHLHAAHGSAADKRPILQEGQSLTRGS
jgi:hypothetical protein